MDLNHIFGAIGLLRLAFGKHPTCQCGKMATCWGMDSGLCYCDSCRRPGAEDYLHAEEVRMYQKMHDFGWGAR